MTYSFEPLTLKGETSRENILEIKDWLNKFNENLEYILNNLDADNLTSDLRAVLTELKK